MNDEILNNLRDYMDKYHKMETDLIGRDEHIGALTKRDERWSEIVYAWLRIIEANPSVKTFFDEVSVNTAKGMTGWEE